MEIKIQEAGKKLISVSDNGKGMEKEDAHLAFKRPVRSRRPQLSHQRRSQTYSIRELCLNSQERLFSESNANETIVLILDREKLQLGLQKVFSKPHKFFLSFYLRESQNLGRILSIA